MSENLISETLQLPQQLSLFKYNVNFNGVKKLLQESNIRTNQNSQSIKNINNQLKTKYTIQQFKAQQKILNNGLKFGINIKKHLDQQNNKFMNVKVQAVVQKTPIQQFSHKISKINQIVDLLLLKTDQNQQKIQADDKKYDKIISDSFKRLEDRIQSSVQSFSNTINNYFNQSNKKSASLQSQFNMLKLSQDNKIKQIQDNVNNKISENGLNNSLQSYKHKILVQMQAQIQGDQMKRLATLQDYKNQLKNLQKDVDLRNKQTRLKVNQLQTKVSGALSGKLFQTQKHKIYQKLSQFNNKSNQLSRKNSQFIEFRKTYLTQKQKTKQQIIGIQDQIKKLNSSQSSFKKMQNVSGLLEKLDPHLICQIANEVKLHEKQIGKLQKKLLMLQANQSQPSLKQSIPIPTGQNSLMMQKILKQYMSNMDFQGRVKKVQKDLYQVSRKTDVFHDLQKKIYTLSKDLDVTQLTKEIKRKCDQQYAKKEFKIVDGKIQNLFDFFKTMRKQMEIIYKRTALSGIKQTPDNPSLTSKKLISTNCLSCTPVSKRRVYSRQKMDYSMDETAEYLKSSTFHKTK